MDNSELLRLKLRRAWIKVTQAEPGPRRASKLRTARKIAAIMDRIEIAATVGAMAARELLPDEHPARSLQH